MLKWNVATSSKVKECYKNIDFFKLISDSVWDVGKVVDWFLLPQEYLYLYSDWFWEFKVSGKYFSCSFVVTSLLSGYFVATKTLSIGFIKIMVFIMKIKYENVVVQ